MSASNDADDIKKCREELSKKLAKLRVSRRKSCKLLDLACLEEDLLDKGKSTANKMLKAYKPLYASLIQELSLGTSIIEIQNRMIFILRANEPRVKPPTLN